ncbi:hypothetical protein HDU83_001249 [Entophlyctis luteolus]|nr:hypothetical protein HDU83_001249 [Entophlyctis luteolus]
MSRGFFPSLRECIGGTSFGGGVDAANASSVSGASGRPHAFPPLDDAVAAEWCAMSRLARERHLRTQHKPSAENDAEFTLPSKRALSINDCGLDTPKKARNTNADFEASLSATTPFRKTQSSVMIPNSQLVSISPQHATNPLSGTRDPQSPDIQIALTTTPTRLRHATSARNDSPQPLAVASPTESSPRQRKVSIPINKDALSPGNRVDLLARKPWLKKANLNENLSQQNSTLIQLPSSPANQNNRLPTSFSSAATAVQETRSQSTSRHISSPMAPLPGSQSVSRIGARHGSSGGIKPWLGTGSVAMPSVTESQDKTTAGVKPWLKHSAGISSSPTQLLPAASGRRDILCPVCSSALPQGSLEGVLCDGCLQFCW